MGNEFQVFYQLSSWHQLKDSFHNARFWKTKARVDKTFSYPTSLRQTVKFLPYLKNALLVLINSSQNQEASRKERLEWSNQQMKQDGIEKCISAWRWIHETDSQKFKVPRHLKLTEYQHKNWCPSVNVITHAVSWHCADSIFFKCIRMSRRKNRELC